MKTLALSLALLLSTVLSLFSQDVQTIRIPLIGETAPAFVAESTKGTVHFPDDYFGKWKILYSHPSDFTPVCTSEIIELAEMQPELEKLNTKVFIVSTDGISSHLEWIKSMESFRYKDRPPVKIDFPFISDKSMEISKKYGMIHPVANTTKDVRGVFIVDPDDHIQAIFFYPIAIGRNMDEIKRTLIALQLSASRNVLTPADWKPGEDVLIHSPQTQQDAQKLADRNDPALYSPVWYLWFKKMK
ncbi:MAG TPA: peroxiredoxin [Bacteroidales bacterium]|nr:peroxiredoxin [Bacteroidales bacterium]